MGLQPRTSILETSSSLLVSWIFGLDSLSYIFNSPSRADNFQGIGMVISAQWELVLGNTYAYTVLSAFGFFYGGFGAIITPLFGVAGSYGTDTAEYNNALGYFVLSKCTTLCSTSV